LIIGALAPKALVSGARDGTTCSSFLGVRSGDILAGIAAQSGEERVGVQFALADLPLRTFLEDHLISYESDEITRLIADMRMQKHSLRYCT
jgi:ethanolamine ammonia-lyase large subunit